MAYILLMVGILFLGLFFWLEWPSKRGPHE